MKKIKLILFSCLTFFVFLPITFASVGEYYETDSNSYMLCSGPGEQYCIEVTKGQSGVEFNLKNGEISYNGDVFYYGSIRQEEYYKTLYGKTRMFYYLNKDAKYVLCEKESSCKTYTFDKLTSLGATINHPNTITFHNGDGPGVPGEVYYYSQEQQDIYNGKLNGTNGGSDGNNQSGNPTVTESADCGRLKEPLKFIGHIVLIFKIVIPIIIIILGTVDFFRAVIGSKDDEMKKSLRSLVFRCIAGVIIFLIPTIVSVIFSLINSWADIKGEFNECQKCVLNVSECK